MSKDNEDGCYKLVCMYYVHDFSWLSWKFVNYWQTIGWGQSAGKKTTAQTWSHSVQHIWMLIQYDDVALVLLCKHV